MIRNIIEYLRKESGISAMDLTLDICSPSMYYAYIKGHKHLSDKKLIALKDRLGADHLSGQEVEEYNKELDEYCDGIFNMRYDFKNLINYYEILNDYHTQMLLDERLITKYLIVMIQFLIYLEKATELNKYLHLFSLIDRHLNKEQLIFYLTSSTYNRALSYDELLDLLIRIEKMIYNLSEDSYCYGFVYLTLGRMYLRSHKHYHSRYFIDQAIEFYRKNDCFRGVVSAKNMLALNMIAMNNVKEALLELNSNLRRATELNYLEEIKNCKTYQILCYSSLNRTDDISSHFQDLLEIFYKGVMPNDYFRLLCILGVLDKYNFRDEVRTLLKNIQNRLPPPIIPIYREFLKCYMLEDEEQKMIKIESIIDCYQDAFYGYDWKSAMYTRLIKYYDTNRRYKKVAEISEKYIKHLKKYIH